MRVKTQWVIGTSRTVRAWPRSLPDADDSAATSELCAAQRVNVTVAGRVFYEGLGAFDAYCEVRIRRRCYSDCPRRVRWFRPERIVACAHPPARRTAAEPT